MYILCTQGGNAIRHPNVDFPWFSSVSPVNYYLKSGEYWDKRAHRSSDWTLHMVSFFQDARFHISVTIQWYCTPFKILFLTSTIKCRKNIWTLFCATELQLHQPTFGEVGCGWVGWLVTPEICARKELWFITLARMRPLWWVSQREPNNYHIKW